jgi:hypothetical protein
LVVAVLVPLQTRKAQTEEPQVLQRVQPLLLLAVVVEVQKELVQEMGAQVVLAGVPLTLELPVQVLQVREIVEV